jgi:Sulfotransferase family
LAELTEARVIIDSSKRPQNAAALRLLDGIDSYLVHLVRDARGVTYSRLRPKPNPDGSGHMTNLSTPYSTLDWMVTNLAAEDVSRHFPPGRTIFLRYEDFVIDPKSTVRRIVSLLGEQYVPDPFIGSHTVSLSMNHMVSGNPDRFEVGTVKLRPDTGWQTHLRPRERRIATALSIPLLLRYGYPLRAADASSSVCPQDGGHGEPMRGGANSTDA